MQRGGGHTEEEIDHATEVREQNRERFDDNFADFATFNFLLEILLTNPPPTSVEENVSFDFSTLPST